MEAAGVRVVSVASAVSVCYRVIGHSVVGWKGKRATNAVAVDLGAMGSYPLGP